MGKLQFSSKTNEDWLDMLEMIDKMATELTKWEIDFVESVSGQAFKVSPRQQQVIEELYKTHVEKL